MGRLIRSGILAVVLVLLFLIIPASAIQPVTVIITSPANNATFAIGQPVTFMASGSPPSSDTACSSPPSYSWSGDEGLSGNGPTVTKVYATFGQKTAVVTYTVYQFVSGVPGVPPSGGCIATSASAQVMITIQPPCLLPPMAPMINALPGAAVLIGMPVTLQAQAINPAGCSRLDYNWQLLSKPPGSLASLLPFSGPTSILTPDLPGTYQVQVSALNEFGNATAQVTITASAPAVNEIHGMKWLDLNANGKRDEGEPLLSGWLITLAGFDNTGKPITQATVTEDGTYSFMNLPDGKYTLCESSRGERQYQQSLPDSGPDCPGSTHGYSVTLSGGQKAEGLDFGNYQLAQIQGRLFIDLNGDGLPEAGEDCPGAVAANPSVKPGCVGVKVQLVGTDGLGHSVSLATTTDDQGAFSFTQLVPGSYQVMADEPAGFTCDFPSQACRYAFTLVSGDLENATFGERLGSAPPRFPNAQLVLEATGSPPAPTTQVGERFTLDFTVTNRGPDDAPQAIFEGDMTYAQGADFVSGKVMTGQGESTCTYQETPSQGPDPVPFHRLIDCSFGLKAQEQGQVELVLTNNGKAASNSFDARAGLVSTCARATLAIATGHSIPTDGCQIIVEWQSFAIVPWQICVNNQCPPPNLGVTVSDIEPADVKASQKFVPGTEATVTFKIEDKGKADATKMKVWGHLSAGQITHFGGGGADPLLPQNGNWTVSSQDFSCCGAQSFKLLANGADFVIIIIGFTVTEEMSSVQLCANVTDDNGDMASACQTLQAAFPDADLSAGVSFNGAGMAPKYEAIKGQSTVDLLASISYQLPDLAKPTDNADLDIVIVDNSQPHKVIFSQNKIKPPAGCGAPLWNMNALLVVHCSFSAKQLAGGFQIVDIPLPDLDVGVNGSITATVTVCWDNTNTNCSYQGPGVAPDDVKDHESNNDVASATLNVEIPVASLAVTITPPFPGVGWSSLGGALILPPQAGGVDLSRPYVNVENTGPLKATNVTVTITIDGTASNGFGDVSMINVPAAGALGGTCQPTASSVQNFPLLIKLTCTISTMNYDLDQHQGTTISEFFAFDQFVHEIDCSGQYVQGLKCGIIKVTASVSSPDDPNSPRTASLNIAIYWANS
jgi:hypothetical protein